ncbi:MAG: laccase domain-containing protein [Actinobacteria bacterium]|nr:laccase domain-containing protein [Actinomycetota bacterium]
MWAATGRDGGASTGVYQSLNLAEYVGDDAGAVAENRRRAAGLVGLDVDGLAVMGAVHGASVGVVSCGGVVAGVDALVSASKGVALLALAADCVPLVLADARAGVIAAVHCGWRGVGSGVVAAAVATMRDLGAVSIEAVVGPAICAGCYPVPAERTQSLRELVPTEVSGVACIDRAGGSFIDVRAGVSVQLALLGIETHHVNACTNESTDLFSYRRDAVTGRQGMIISRA